MKNLTVSEAKNHITGFHKIGVLSFVSRPNTWTIVPVSAITLNNDGVVGKLEVNHELAEHNHLLIEGNPIFAQSIGHRPFNIGTWIRCKALEIAKYAVLLAAVLTPAISRRVCLKFLAAVVTYDGNLRLPVGIICAETTAKLTRSMEASFGTIKSIFANILTYLELLAALLAGPSYLRVLFVHLLDAIVSKTAVVRAILGITGTTSNGVEGNAADDAFLRYAWGSAAFVRTEDVFAFIASGNWYINRFAASGAGVEGHKRNLLSDGWHVCLGHAGPTGGIHNYIRLWANHQAQACPKPLHYSTGVRGMITA